MFKRSTPTLFSILRLICGSLVVWPFVLLFLSLPKNHIFVGDVRRWVFLIDGISDASKLRLGRHFLEYMIKFREIRNLLYYRVKWARVLSMLAPPERTLFIYADHIGEGLFIQHGFATIIAAHSIGKHCWINQQVTIGFRGPDGKPTIGDNVRITAGAKVLGDIVVGNDVIVGANAVVVKDVPAGCTVVGVPAYIVRRNGRRESEGS